MTKAMTPAEFDAAEYALMEQAGKIQSRMDARWNEIHRAAGDKKRYYGRRSRWQMRDGEALSIVKRLAGIQRLESLPLQDRAARQARDLVADLDVLHDQLTSFQEQIAGMEDAYRQAPWTRYFPCLNADGHIHSSLRGCATVRNDTAMGWETALSGQEVDVIVQMPPAGLGPRLCSVCFPDAPVEHCRSLSDITRAEREAAAAAKKAEREAKRLIKELSDDDIFRDRDGHRVTTVNRCKELIREEVEGRDRWGQGPSRFHDQMVADRRKAANILIAREAAAPGTGMTQEAIVKMIENAVIRNRKAGARI